VTATVDLESLSITVATFTRQTVESVFVALKKDQMQRTFLASTKCSADVFAVVEALEQLGVAVNSPESYFQGK